MARDTPLKEFVNNVAKSNDPMVARQMYNITYECTSFEVLRLNTEGSQQPTLQNTL